ncbi:MAG: septal ring lytic transglycosylase RlpA family protein [Nitriliruptorales bacterium]|nr:septal ring lytic transglycosylase RlpA family protein [Nitriliruptorales bacterium]
MVPPPHPPRANIRTLPATESGTELAGRASWYGPGFAGRQTACGGIFDPAALTLASRELRCGTIVTVTGTGGRSTQATVTDWGPAEWTSRRFDLSQATFAAVAGLGAGVIDVTVTVN